MARRYRSGSSSSRRSKSGYSRRSTSGVRKGNRKSFSGRAQTVRLVIQQEAPSAASPVPLSERLNAATPPVKPGKAKF